jgi:DNA polymerase III gamma/tau subunit
MSVETKPKPLLHPRSIQRLQTTSKRTKQSVLLTGNENVGLSGAARWLAEEVVGENWNVSLFDIKPGENGSISIDEIHKIRKITQYKSAGSSDRKVVIINSAHTMTIDAQNSYLKILEEPPADVYMILLSWQPEKLLPTIRSRLAAIELHPATFEQIVTHHPNTDANLIKRLYLMTNGSADLISEILQDREHPYSQIIQSAKTLVGQSVYERMAIVDELSKDKLRTEELLKGVTIVLSSALNSFAEQGKSVKSLLPKLEAVLSARTALRKNHNTKLTLTLLFSVL